MRTNNPCQRNIIILVLFSSLFSVSPSPGQTIFMIHEFNLIYRGEFKPRLSIQADHWFNEKLSFSSYLYATPTWGEGDVGAGYQLTDWAFVGFMVGLQNEEDHPFRIRPSFFLKRGKWSLLGLFGHGIGTESDRFALQFFYNFKTAKIGVEGIKEFTVWALGPRFDLTLFPSPNVHVWAAPYYDFTYGKYAAMFGLYAVFGNNTHQEIPFD